MEFNKYFDHTLLKQDATEEGIKALCLEAKEHDFASVCVNPCFVPLAHSLLKDTDVKVCTVIGFPLGANETAVKCFEADLAIKEGASEIDMVLNVSNAKMHRFDLIEKEIAEVKKACGKILLKVILETCLLSDEEIKQCSLAAVRAGADFVKTSTGFSKGGATAEAVRIMREAVGPNVGVKASGGIRSYADAKAMIEAGANRIGASASIAILEQKKAAGE